MRSQCQNPTTLHLQRKKTNMTQINLNLETTRTNDCDELLDRRRSSPVQVTTHPPPECDEEDWGIATEKRMQKIVEQNQDGCFYLNPLFTVSSLIFSKAFSNKARKCQSNWYRRVDQTLIRKHRKRRERELKFYIRQLTYTGILIIDGKDIPPHEWTMMEKQRRDVSIPMEDKVSCIK